MRDSPTPPAHLSPTTPIFKQPARAAGPRGPALLQDIWLIEKLAHFDREVIPERRMHAKGWGAHGTFTVTGDITRYTLAKIFSEVGKKTPMFARFSTSQLPLSAWHEVIGDPAYADAILDRLVHNAHRIELTGESLRRARGKQSKTA